MQKYYLPLRILAVLHMIAPLANMFFSSYLSDMSLTHYLQVSWQNSPLIDLIILYLAPPLAGLALWQQNKNSYFVYMFLFAVMSLRNVYEFSSLSYRYSWQLIGLFLSANLAVLIYLLNTNVRAVFFNTFTAKDLKLNDLQLYKKCKITNLNNEGIYIRGGDLNNIKVGDQISFKLKDLEFTDTVHQVSPSARGVEVSFSKPVNQVVDF